MTLGLCHRQLGQSATHLFQFHGGGDDGALGQILRLPHASLRRQRFLAHAFAIKIRVAGGIPPGAAQGTAET